MARERKKPPRGLLDAARDHQEVLEAAGLPAGVVERYETALRGLEWQGRPLSAAAKPVEAMSDSNRTSSSDSTTTRPGTPRCDDSQSGVTSRCGCA